MAAYDGKGRLMGLRTAEATDSSAVYNWYSWMGDPVHQADLQDLQLDPKQTTTDPQLGGNWTTFTRNDLGTLTAVDVDDQTGVEWTASTFANGPGLTEVTLSGEGSSSQFPIVWDSAGRANAIDGHWFLWTGDDRPAQVLVGHTQLAGLATQTLGTCCARSLSAGSTGNAWCAEHWREERGAPTA